MQKTIAQEEDITGDNYDVVKRHKKPEGQADKVSKKTYEKLCFKSHNTFV